MTTAMTATVLGTIMEDGKRQLKSPRIRERLIIIRIVLGAIVIGAFLIFVIFS